MYSSRAKANSYKRDMGERIRQCRLNSNLTQEKMAELLDISIKHYSEVERGITGLSIDNLVHLSSLLGVSIDYLIKGDTTNENTVPHILVETYQSCPDSKKRHFLELIHQISLLMYDNS